jgi:hypothetical protein
VPHTTNVESVAAVLCAVALSLYSRPRAGRRLRLRPYLRLAVLLTLAANISLPLSSLLALLVLDMAISTLLDLCDPLLAPLPTLRRAGFTFAAAALAALTLTTLLYAAFPRSEYASFGNASLRHLSPSVRSYLRLGHLTPSQPILWNTAVSLYLPSAGFLYASGPELSFQDRLGTMEPWYIRHAILDDATRHRAQDPEMKTGDVVFVKHAVSRVYVSTDSTTSTDDDDDESYIAVQ